MGKIENSWIYDTAERAFRFGSFSYDSLITGLSLSDGPVFEGKGECVIPGFVDIHMHIESSMMTPSSFALASLPHGTTTIVSDCHEVANVAGVKGLQDFMALPTANHTYYAVPSSVPASSLDLETSNGSFDAEEVAVLAKDKKVVALGEVMNANDLFSQDENRTKRIIRTFSLARPECPIEGHCPRFTGPELDRFIASGVDSDHTEQTPASLKEKLSKGMFLELQYKSIHEDVIAALSPTYDGHYSFVTDDVLPDVLLQEGHLDRVLRKAMSYGLSPERAIYAATYSPAVRMRLFDRGWIAPGKKADFIVLEDLASLRIKQVFVSGICVYDAKRGLLAQKPKENFEPHILNSIIRTETRPEEYRLKAYRSGTQQIKAISHSAESTMTRLVEMEITAGKDLLIRDKRINILASVERYGHQNPIIPVPLIGGIEKEGAICSSWAHDSHNLLVMATDEKWAALAVNTVIARQGGIACIDDEGSLFVPLSYGGIVSTDDNTPLAEGISKVRAWLKRHGYRAVDEIMSFAVLALPVSPEAKVTDKGLVDVRAKKVIDWRENT